MRIALPSLFALLLVAVQIGSLHGQDYGRAMAVVDSLNRMHKAAMDSFFPLPDADEAPEAFQRVAECMASHMAVTRDSLYYEARRVLARNNETPTLRLVAVLAISSSHQQDGYARALCVQPNPPSRRWWLDDLERTYFQLKENAPWIWRD